MVMVEAARTRSRNRARVEAFTVVPVGVPVADKLIELLKPPLMLVVMVDVPGLP